MLTHIPGLHGTATVAMTYLILDLWDCGLYWLVSYLLLLNIFAPGGFSPCVPASQLWWSCVS